MKFNSLNHTYIYSLLIAFFLLACKSDPPITEPDPSATLQTKLDHYLGQYYQQGRFNGTVLVADKGDIIFEKSYGFADFKQEIPLENIASFRLASVSKQFTAAAIMLLKQDSLLNYDDPVKQHLPTFPYEGINIRHILTHTSGLTDYMSLFDDNWEKDEKEKPLAFNGDLLKLYAELKPELDFPTGEKWAYSNTAYVVAASVVEAITGKDVGLFMAERVFEPLGMQHTSTFSPDSTRFNPQQRVYGTIKTPVGRLPNDYHYLNGMLGDGGFYASARDLLAWDQALYTDSILQQSTLQDAFQPTITAQGDTIQYGFGWSLGKSPTDAFLSQHTGGWVGFRTYFGRFIGDQKTVIFLSSNSCGDMDEIVKTINRVVYGDIES